MRTKFFVGAAALLAVAAFAAQESAKVEWKPEVGKTSKYKIAVAANIDAGGQKMDMNFAMHHTAKVTKVEGGKVVVEIAADAFSLMVNGEDMTQMMGDQKYNSTTTFNANGEPLESKSDSPSEARQERLENAFAFYYPNKEVKVGEAWGRKVKGDAAKSTVDAEATYTLEAVETVGEAKNLRIGFTYKETAGDTPMTGAGTVWLTASVGELVKGTYSMKNVQFDASMPPTDATATVTRIDK
ncbi:MAG: hypothetical protein H0W86_01240 [Armatimonadetes bacterium]|nr:hypothetical protein [Armatimonadota bacterium]